MKLTIRPASLSECEAYVYSTWLRGQNTQRARVDRILQDASELMVATPEEDPSEILAWAAGDSLCLDYVYVRAWYRRRGVATALWRALGEPKFHSHSTRLGRRFFAQHKLKPYEVAHGKAQVRPLRHQRR